ncbi:ubiquitin carboxyl-terminal hydrolase MINDY-3 [Coregonus clupeaformis]|uniref:ubiquitin carboxyl-terminal hydrolase MINDY-3 n=1 Tax=Coregonus clupeaformis TaxID=59861 RepID=UPI001E1C6B1B|nr:ubiquitin carboxyl-terminal hydrolase MINDY-3 [Coregonus clupeaformis]
MGELNKEVVDIVWERPGSNGMSASIFRRWTQGLVFSETEHTALEQFEGGPCAVIAPVQAFLLKNILFNRESSNWRHITVEEQKAALCSTLAEILEQACSTSSTTSYCLVTWAKGQSPHTTTHTPLTGGPETSQNIQDQQPTALAAEDLGFERFHSILQKRIVKSLSELREEVVSLYETWKGRCGVLLFLYSVILTKGIENIKNEIEDTTEPLIDPVYGHGSQNLVNLLVTGHAVSNVWDGDRECSGMKLHGIHNQASVGFLTLMESLRYCKVGAFLKSPKFPIWILGSETHLSVFFAKEMCLVAPESPSEQARRVFQTFDPEDNGFIPDSLLEEVMKALDLVSEPEYYVSLMKSKLDQRAWGSCCWLRSFLEFFPDQTGTRWQGTMALEVREQEAKKKKGYGIPDSFPVYHYNGLKQVQPGIRWSMLQGTALVWALRIPMVIKFLSDILLNV